MVRKNAIKKALNTSCVVGLDPGFKSIKVVALKSGQIEHSSIPSIAPVSLNTQDGLTADMDIQKRNTITIDIGKRKYEVGPQATLITEALNTGSVLTENFPATDEYKALVLGALYYANTSYVNLLVLGLPNHTMSSYCTPLTKMLPDPVEVNGRLITVEKILVIPQPIGTLFLYGRQQRARPMQGTTRLIIDPGYYTTDWVVATGYIINPARSKGCVGGISHVLAAAAEKLREKYGPAKLEDIDAVLCGKRPFVPIYSQEILIDELNRYIEESSPIIENIIRAMASSVKDPSDIQEIVLTGGGSHIFERFIKRAYGKINVIKMPNPDFANALGFMLYGQRQWKRIKEGTFAKSA